DFLWEIAISGRSGFNIFINSCDRRAVFERVSLIFCLQPAMYSLNKLRLALGFGAVLMIASTTFAIDSKLESQAKISKLTAEKIALSQVATGVIQSGELEKERGKLIWSFDI